MIGDGYTVVRHCEFADVPAGVEPDAEPVYCTDDENTTHPLASVLAGQFHERERLC